MEKIDYLIYGSTGFIGSYLYEKLKSNHKTISIGRSERNDINLNDLKIKNLDVKTLIHSAGIAHIKKHANGFDEGFMKEDLAITSNLIKYIHNYKINKVIYFSSVSVYGKNTGISIDLNSKLVGISGYSKCKIESETMLLNWGNDWYSNSQQETISVSKQTDPGVVSNAPAYRGTIYLMAFA